MKGQNTSFKANLHVSAGKCGLGKYILPDCGSELSRRFVGRHTLNYRHFFKAFHGK